MKVKVLKKFRDKYTHVFYGPGQILEVTEERFEEMNSTSHGIFVEAIPEETDKSKAEPKQEPKKAEPKQEPKKKSTKK